MSVYEQLKQWQKIPHARREWAGYRRQLTEFVIRHTAPDSVAAILGAGHCDDLDLSALSGHFSKIILVDRDFSSMEGSTAGWQLSARCEVQKQQKDFLGITDQEYEDYCDCLQQGIRLRGRNTDIRELSELARRRLDPLYGALQAHPLELVDGGCDYLIAAGLHSQLDNLSVLIWNAYEQALGQHAPWMYPYFAKHNEEAAARFDERLLREAGHGLILALERQRLGIPGSVQGAARGLLDMEGAVRMGRLERTAQERLYWNFDIAQGIAYEMDVCAYHKTEK